MGHFALPLPRRLKNEDWRVKIRTREKIEPPHVTIIRGTKSWRYNIRNLGFMDRDPPPREVPDELVAVVHDNLDTIREKWNEAYPNNPV